MVMTQNKRSPVTEGRHSIFILELTEIGNDTLE